MLLFQVFVVSISMLVSFSFLRNVEGRKPPSPHSSKKHDKRCDCCQAYVSDLDPHPVCQKCVPRECSKELPCSHCASLSPDAWKKWECQQASRRSSSYTKGAQRGFGQGGEQIWEGNGPLGALPRCSVNPQSRVSW